MEEANFQRRSSDPLRPPAARRVARNITACVSSNLSVRAKVQTRMELEKLRTSDPKSEEAAGLVALLSSFAPSSPSISPPLACYTIGL